MKRDYYLISKNTLLEFLRYEILYKWKESEKIYPENKSFAKYLLNNTQFIPEHEFIQSLCTTEEEHKDPVKMGIYEDILPADIARYQLNTLYVPYKENCL